MDKKYKWAKRTCIFLVFLGLIWIRAGWFEQHFTHYDDIKVAQFTDFTTNVFDQKFRGRALGHGRFFTDIYNLLSIGFSKIYNWIFYALNFSKYWTYAPGQFVFTFALLPLAYDYTSIKFFGRLPSLVIGCIALAMCWKAAKKYTGSDRIACVAACILGFSWQSILYCMHMSNYESIILTGFIAANLLYNTLERHRGKDWVTLSLIIGALTWFHYQTVCYFGGLMLVCIVYSLMQKTPVKNIIWKVICSCAAYALIVMPLLFFANVNGVPTWNVGTNGQYLFSFSFDLIYMIKFFCVNSFVTFKAMLSPVPLSTVLAFVLAVFYLVFFIYGSIRGIRDHKTNNVKFYLTVFCWGSLLTEYFFVFTGKFTLSPTRHSNVMIPLYILQIMLGIYYLVFETSFKKKIVHVPVVICLFICFCWALFAAQVKEERKDLYSTDSVMTLVNDYSPDLIIDVFAPQLWYIIGSQCGRKDIIDYKTDCYDQDLDPSNNKKILIVSATQKIDEQVIEQISDMLVEREYLTEDLIRQLSETEPVAEYEYRSYADYDLHNVTGGSPNCFCYCVYDLE